MSLATSVAAGPRHQRKPAAGPTTWASSAIACAAHAIRKPRPDTPDNRVLIEQAEDVLAERLRVTPVTRERR